MDIEEVGGFEDVSSNMSIIVFLGFCFIIFVYFMLVVLNSSSLRASQEDFQRGLTNAVRAYSTTYSTTPEALKYLSEGYLLSEDMNIYGIDSNPVQINRTIASEYFFNILDSSVPMSKELLKSCGVYIIDVVTHYDGAGNPTYRLSIYKDGVTALLVNADARSLIDVQLLVEERVGDIKIDIAEGFNASLREAQKYKDDTSHTGDGQETYSTYSTTMTIIKDVPMCALFGFQRMDVKEIQTYSIKRGDK